MCTQCDAEDFEGGRAMAADSAGQLEAEEENEEDEDCVKMSGVFYVLMAGMVFGGIAMYLGLRLLALHSERAEAREKASKNEFTERAPRKFLERKLTPMSLFVG